MKGSLLVVIQVAAAEEGSESYTQAKEAATTAEEEAATWIANFDPKPKVLAILGWLLSVVLVAIFEAWLAIDADGHA